MKIHLFVFWPWIHDSVRDLLFFRDHRRITSAIGPKIGGCGEKMTLKSSGRTPLNSPYIWNVDACTDVWLLSLFHNAVSMLIIYIAQSRKSIYGLYIRRRRPPVVSARDSSVNSLFLVRQSATSFTNNISNFFWQILVKFAAHSLFTYRSFQNLLDRYFILWFFRGGSRQLYQPKLCNPWWDGEQW